MKIDKIDQKERNKMIVHDCDFHGLSRADVAKKYNLSGARVAQIYFQEKAKKSLEDMPVEQIEMMKVTDLPLTFRFKGCITQTYGYNVLCRDINDIMDYELLAIPNFGRDTLKEWREFQIKHGLIKRPQNTQGNDELIKKIDLIRENLQDQIDSIMHQLRALDNAVYLAYDELSLECR